MAWNKESLERAKQSVQEFDEENEENKPADAQEEKILAAGRHGEYILSDINGTLFFKSNDIYGYIQKEIDEPNALRLVQEHKMQFTDKGAERFGEPFEEKHSPIHARNASGTTVLAEKELNLTNAGIERTGVIEKDCYTFHPEKDVLDEIFRRLYQAEITVLSYEEFLEHTSDGEIYAVINNTVDLRFADMREGANVSIPITDNERGQIRQASLEYETVRRTELPPVEQNGQRLPPLGRE